MTISFDSLAPARLALRAVLLHSLSKPFPRLCIHQALISPLCAFASLRELFPLSFFRCHFLEAGGTALLVNISGIEQFLCFERLLTGKAELAAGFLQSRINTDALVEDKALPLIVGTSALLEVF